MFEASAGVTCSQGRIPRALSAVLVLVCAAAFMLSVVPGAAYAASASDTAYKRSVKAINNYRNEPAVITVDVSDLGLSKSKLNKVIDRVHYEGRYFWVSTIGLKATSTQTISYRCLYSDAQITSMRKKLNASISDAMSCIKKGMSKADKVHMLHDWVCRHSKWVSASGNTKYKYSYGPIVLGRGDCQGYMLAMATLLHKAGFTTDAAVNEGIDHTWNLVKVGSRWYHVDAGWDSSYFHRGTFGSGMCHMYLLRSDSYMRRDPLIPAGYKHAGWKVVLGHKASKDAYAKKSWSRSCPKRAHSGKTFTRASVKYRVNKGKKSVTVRGASGSSVDIPSRVLYKGYWYSVTAINAKAFNKKKLKKVTIGSNVAAIGSRAFYKAKKLKAIEFAGKKLKKVGGKAFAGVPSSVVVDAPSSKIGKYRSLMRKAGLGKKASFV